MNIFNYQNSNSDFELVLHRANRRYSLYDVLFTSAATGTEKIPGEYYLPRGEKAFPLVILLHGMGDTSLTPPRALARSLAGAGYACFIPHLVVHSSRTPKLKGRANNLTLDEWFEAYRASVIESRQIVDWAGQRQEIDNAKIAILGISFGAFVAALALGVEKRLSAGVLIECGGNAIRINQLSRAMRSRYPGPALDHTKLLEEYDDYLKRVAERGVESVVPAQRAFLTDPLTYASSIKTRPLLMINALQDELIPRQSAMDLWQATGKQDIAWLPGTHVTLWVWYAEMRRKIKSFLTAALGD